MSTISTDSIRKSKNRTPLVMLTAYDYLFAKLFDPHVDILLVGDSLNMSFNGQSDTLSLSLDAMIYHTQAVCRAAEHALVMTDMPFGSVATPEQALHSCIRVYKETGAKAVKIEGGIEACETVALLTAQNIAVMSHIGLRPQQVRQEGGYKIKGKDEKDTERLINEAQALEQAGAFSLLLEGVKAESAKTVTESVNIPVIGIGSGPHIDGQVLVWSDMLGLYQELSPKFVRHYLEGADLIENAVKSYCEDVRERRFPDQTESY